MQYRGVATGSVRSRRWAWRVMRLLAALGSAVSLLWLAAPVVQAQTAHYVGAPAVDISGTTLRSPFGASVSSSGEAYIGDQGNSRILQLTPSTGLTSTAYQYNATTDPGCGQPVYPSVDSSGNVYFACSDTTQVYKVPLNSGAFGTATLLSTQPNGTGGRGTVVDSYNNLWVVELNNNSNQYAYILKCTTSGSCSTYYTFPSGSSLGQSNNVSPYALAEDSSGNFYIGDVSNNRVVWKLSNTGTASSPVAGTLTNIQSCPPASGEYSNPGGCYGIAVSASGVVYMSSNGPYIYKLTPNGSGGYISSTVYPPPGLLHRSVGIALDPTGTILYAADYTDNNQSLSNGLQGPSTASTNFVQFAASGQGFGSVAVGSTASTTLSLTFSIDTTGTLGSIAVLTQGVAGLDFANAGTGTCQAGHNYTSAPTTCTVNVTFTPTKAGLRQGAVELLNSSGTPIATAMVFGTGTGPQVNFTTVAQKTLDTFSSSTTNLAAEGLVSDAAGNLYVVGVNTLYKETYNSGTGTYTQSVLATSENGTNFSGLQGLAIDGAGNLYLGLNGSPGTNGNGLIVKETLLSNGTYTPTVICSNNSSANPQVLCGANQVAVDLAGNVYFLSGQQGQVEKMTATVQNGTVSYSAPVAITSFSSGPNPWGIAVDPSGNVFFTGAGSNTLYQLTPSGTGYVQSTLDTTLSDPCNIALDTLGNIYVANYQSNGTGTLVKETYNGPLSYTKSTLVSNTASNTGIVGVWADINGNLFFPIITSNGSTSTATLQEFPYATPPSLTFATTNEGATTTTTTSGTNPVTLQNVGNAALTFPVPSTGTDPSVAANFSLGSSTCPTLTTSTSSAGSLAAGSTCNYPITFAPTIGGSISGSIVLTDNNLNASNATQSIPVSGQANWQKPTVTSVTPGTGPIAGGTTVTIGGNYLSGATGVSFGGTAATIVTDTLTSMTVTSPAASSVGSVDVTVTTTGGTSNTSSADMFLYQATPTVTLTMTSGGSTVSSPGSITSGNALKLTATVKVGTNPVNPGIVAFCSSTTSCTDINLLGTVPLTTAGTASVSFVPGIGSHSYRAIFLPTAGVLTATSSTSTLTVTAASTQPTTTTINAATGTSGNYSLSATVTSTGIYPPAGPTGTVSFLDTTNSNANVGPGGLSSALGTPTVAYGFATATSFAVGSGPQREVLFDYNNDGKLDLAVCNTSANNVTVYTGNGNGTFNTTAVATFQANTSMDPNAITAGDFNGDGYQDLAITNFGGSAYIYLGNGSGTFTLKQTITEPTNSQSVWISAGDFNNDGILDLVMSNWTTNALTVYLGNGDGTFTLKSTISPGGPPISTAVADFNGDGKLDFAVTFYSTTGMQVYQGNGDGTFTLKSTPETGNGYYQVVSADFNGDGIADLAVANTGGPTVSVLQGVGDGTFTANPSISLSNGAAYLVVGDFNGDGIVDLATDLNGGGVAILTGLGTGTFTNTTANSPALGQVVAGDLNGDGLTDIVGISQSGNMEDILLDVRTWTATASASGVAVAGSGTHTIEASYAGDTNYAASTSSGTDSLTANTLPTVLTLSTNVSSPQAYGTPVTITAQLSPYASQGHTTSGETVIFKNNGTQIGTGSLNSSGQASFTTTSLPIATNSLTAIYGTDIYFATATSTALPFQVNKQTPTVTLNLTQTSGGGAATSVAAGTPVTLTATVTSNSAAVKPGIVNFCNATASYCTGTNLLGSAELTPSGTAAISLAPPAGSPSYTAVFLGNTTVFPATSASVPLTVTAVTPVPSNTTITSSGSAGNYTLQATVTGGTVVSGGPTGTVNFLDTTNGNYQLNTAPVTLGTPTSGTTFASSTLTTGSAPTWAVTADFNGDGKLDIAIANQGSSTISVYLSTGSGTYTVNTFSTGSNTSPNAIAVGDFNGDGILDLAVADGGSQVGIFTGSSSNRGTFTNTATYVFSYPPEGIVVADFNNDGILDIAVTTYNVVNVMLGKGDGTFNTAIATASLGSTFDGYGIAALDYNNDGNMDLAVVNYQGSASTNQLQLLQGNGTGSFTAGPAFTTCSQPYGIVAADFNKDGHQDLAVNCASSYSISVFLANSSGGFNGVNTYAASSFLSEGMVAADFNGDGNLDLAVGSAISNSFSVLLGSSSGAFGTATSVSVGGSQSGLATGDLNNDGIPDLVVLQYQGTTAKVLLTQATSATATLSGVSVVGTGTHLVDAVYSGDTNYAASTSANTVSLTASALATTTTLTVGPASPQTYGTSVTLTATVSPSTGQGHSAGGTVTFYNGSLSLGSPVTVSGGTAALALTTLPSGTLHLKAVYSGDTNFATSTSSTATYVINGIATATSLTIKSGGNTVSTVSSGTAVTLTATVTANGSTVTSGTVKFCDATATYCTDIHRLGSAQITSAGTATLSLVPSVGSHSYSAVYLPSISDQSSTSASAPLSVTGSLPTTTTIAATGTAGNYTLTSTVTGNGSQTASVAGSVLFQDATNGNATIGSGAVTLGTSTPSAFFVASNNTPSYAPYSAELVDLNGDGKLDLVAANLGNATVTTLLGNGDGTFASPVTLSNLIGTAFVAVGDFNNDGKPDAAITLQAYGQVLILLGNGDGTLNKQSNEPSVGSTPLGIVAGDFNRDGNLDLAVANTGGSTVSILLGNGDGTFSGPSSVGVGSSPERIAVGDFNGDGVPDLAVTNYGSNSVTVLLGNGDGTFTAASASPSTGTHPIGIAVADFNGDGKLDLAVANGGSNSVTVLLGNGDGTFNAASASPGTGSNPRGISVGDFNSDGKVDLAVANSNDGTVSLLLGHGDGTFATATTQNAGNTTFSVAVGDLNGDGTADIVAANYGSNSLTVLLNEYTESATASISNVSLIGTGTHNVKASYSGSSSYAASVSATTAITAQPVTTTLSLSTSTASSTYGQSVTLTATLSPYTAQGHTAGGTVTFYSDGSSIGTGTLTGGTATFTLTTLPVATHSLTASYAGDTNFASSTTSSGTSFTVNPILSTATLVVSSGGASPVSTVALGSKVTLTATVVSGSGPVVRGTVNFCNAAASYCTDQELVGTAQLTSAGTASVSLYPGVGSHSYKAVFVGASGAGYVGASSAASMLSVTGLLPSVTTITDTVSSGSYTLTATVTGSGSLTTTPSGSVSFLDTSNGNFSLASPTLVAGSGQTALAASTITTSANANPFTPVIADFNGDGKPDIAVALYSEATIGVWLGNGDGTVTAVTGAPAVGNNPQGMAAGDFNNDGKPDLVVSNGGSGSLTLLLGNGDGTFNATSLAASGTRGVAVADFNGDGQLDVAVANGGNNNVTVLLGNGNGTFTAAPSPAAGANVFGIVAGDFNGDGHVDLAVTDYSVNQVTILLGNGDGTFTAGTPVSVGTAPGDILAGDFNGDGVLDLAVDNANGTSVSILLGHGDGTFTAAAGITTANSPAHIALGDFNHDGITDVAVVDNQNVVTLYPGHGDGTFGAALATATVGNNNFGVAAADLNGDGFTDLVATNLSDNTFSIVLTQATVTATATASGVAVAGTGTHNVKASFPGDGNYAASVSTTTGITAQPVATALSLSANPASSSYAQSVTLTATLSPYTAQGHTAGGTVTFYSDGSSIGTGTLTGGTATFTLTTLPVATHSLTASYAGDTNFAASATTSGTSFTVNPIPSTATLVVSSGGTSPASTVALGSKVTLTATVVSGSGPVVRGTVNFCNAAASYCTDQELVGTAQLTSAGTASVSLYPGVGSHSYKAVFLGGGGGTAASSTSSTLIVTSALATTTTISTPSGSAGNYSLTATVTGTGFATGPSTTVNFLDTTNANFRVGTATLGAGTLSVSYTNPQTLALPSGPAFGVTGDFNGDGIPDMAFSSNGANNLTIALGNGDGTFTAVSTQPAATGAYGIAVGDFNGDGKLDLAVTNYQNAAVTILLGNGDGTFSAGGSVAVGSYPWGISVGDFNGDGNLDVVTTNIGGNNVTILLGHGDGTFTAASVSPAVGSFPTSASVGDFNGDGKLDIAVANFHATTVTILLGNGDGTFTAAANVNVGSGPITVVAGDLNGDGKLDLAVNNYSAKTITTYLGNGDGTFGTATVTLSLPGNGAGMVLADLNGDGQLDLATEYSVTNFQTFQQTNTAAIYAGNGSGGFMLASTQTTGQNPQWLLTGDWNGDGYADLAVENGSTATVLLTQITESATATATGISPAGSGTHNVEASYAGDTHYAASVSSTVPLTAQAAATTLTLTASPTSSTYGQSVTFTATLAPYTAQGHPTDGETVSFAVGSTPLGTGTLSGGVATLSVTTLPGGSDTITASYAGDTNFAASSGSLSSYTVSPATKTISFPQPTTPVGVNSTATLSATSSNGDPVTYSITAGSATISGSTITYTTSGTVTIAANSAATANYSAAPTVTRMVTVNSASTVYAAPTTAVGAPSATQTATINIATAGTLGTIYVVTQGVSGLDYNLVSGGTCTVGAAYSAGQACTVEYSFAPLYPGRRLGGVLLFSNASTPVLMGESLLHGTGTGPQALFSTPVATALASGFNGARGVSVDAAGNVYVAESSADFFDKISPAGVVTQYPTSGLPTATAVDGAGNIFIASQNYIYEMPFGSTALSLYASGVVHSDNNMVVDSSGNLYITQNGNSGVYKFPAAAPHTPTVLFYGGTNVAGVATGRLIGSAIDANDNLYLLDFSHSRVLKVAAGSSTPTLAVSDSAIYYSQAIAVDAAGDLYVATANGLNRYAYANGSYGSGVSLASYTAASVGAVMGQDGTLYLIEGTGSAVDKYVRTSTPALTFPSTSGGSTSAPQSTLIENDGNAALVPTAVAASASFTVVAGSGSPPDCLLAGTVAAGANCNLSVAFAPTGTQNGVVTGIETLTDNNLNGLNVAQTVQLSGTAAALPTVTAVSPAGGAPAGGTTVTITGTNLSGATAVSFGPNAAASFTVNSATSITAVSPPGAGTVDVQVTTPAGVSAASTADQFLYFGTQTISFTPPSPLIFGVAPITLTATGGASGNPVTFTLLSGPGTLIGSTLTVTGAGSIVIAANQAGGSSYTAAPTVTATIVVNQATPTIVWATPSSIPYGTQLSAAQLNATSPTAGTFAYSPAVGTTPPVGTDTLSVTFTPTDTADYTTATATVQIVVGKATPTLTWSAPAAISYGTQLSAAQLNATASVAGTFAYSPAVGSVPPTGTDTLSVSFTPTDTADYTTATATVQIVVGKATPTLTWSAPAAISYGTPLSAAQLNATSSTAGTFAYSPAVGSVPPVGTDTLSVTFTPSDPADYTTATDSVQLTVGKATPAVTLTATPTPTTFATAVTLTFTLPPVNGIAPTGVVSFYTGATLLGTGNVSATGIATLVTSALPLGSDIVTAQYPGDSTYAAASPSVTVQVGMVGFGSGDTLTSSNLTPLTTQPVTFTFTVPTVNGVAPTGTVNFYNATTLLGAGTLVQGVATLTSSALPAGQDIVTATYSGDATYTGGTLSLTEQVTQSGFTITSSSQFQSVNPGDAAVYNVTLTGAALPANSTLTLSATGLPPGATVTFSPLQRTSGTTATATMTVLTSLTQASLERRGGAFPVTYSLLLLPLLGVKRVRRTLRRLPRGLACALFASLLLAGASAIAGCGGSYFGPPPQTYTITITGTSGSLVSTTTVQLEVR